MAKPVRLHDVITPRWWSWHNLELYPRIAATFGALIIPQCGVGDFDEEPIPPPPGATSCRMSGKVGVTKSGTRVQAEAKVKCTGPQPSAMDINIELDHGEPGNWQFQAANSNSAAPLKRKGLKVKVWTDCVPGRWRATMSSFGVLPKGPFTVPTKKLIHYANEC